MADLRTWLTDPHPSIATHMARWMLRGLSLPYAIAIRLRNWGYDTRIAKTKRVEIPVVSIGNLSVGGTGKTPTVAWIASWFRARGVRVAIVSRGYGRLENGSNDEALELELRLPDVPHLQNPDRSAAALLAQDELGMQLILLDDGFQHRRLGRDLDIVLIDATDSPASRWMLPGGLFREPLSSLRRAQVVMLTRCNLASPERLAELHREVQRAAPRAIVVESSHQPRAGRMYPSGSIEIKELENTPVLAFCAIGNPAAFFDMLKSQQMEVVASRTWPDHHAFTSEDVAQLTQWAAAHPTAKHIVCTMKDWVKLQVPRLGALPLIAIEIQMDISRGGDQLEQELERLVRERITDTAIEFAG